MVPRVADSRAGTGTRTAGGYRVAAHADGHCALQRFHEAARLITRIRFALAAVLLLASSFHVATVFAQEAQVLRVDNIRVEGLQRVSEGTVYNYLPVNIGDRLTQQRVREAIRALYDTGFFRDVELRWEAGTLIVAVLERPSIESFEIKGNKDIKTEDLNKSLRNVGLATGK
ncbi:MAG: hypothetical protein EB102_09715, partial [Gammaproteobacteria bacterium]|nr:hypothetical protein [Gammaproteobacteria bacterium]